jgi:ubiquinone/menaquinone biosynthesis C-methylase UbiE
MTSAEQIRSRLEDEDEIDLYTDGAELFDAVYSGFQTEDEKEEAVRENFEEGASILDVACGTGILADRLDSDYDVTGLDSSKDMLDIARERGLNADFVQGDMRHLPFRGEFDAVVMFGQPLSHLDSREEVEQAVASAYRALGDDGVLVSEFYDENAGRLGFMEPVIADIEGGKVGMTAKFQDYDDEEASWTGELHFDVYSPDGSTDVVSRQDLLGFNAYEIGEVMTEQGFSVVDDQDFYEGNLSHCIVAHK